jgi:hypothetical protein
MPITAPSIDPLARYLNSELTQGHRQRIPLVATHLDVIIRGGLAVVATERTFRNVENKSIEATLTFPVPVDATLCALAARIDGRVLSAMAQAREEARASYESALDAGKGAILHEELLKGIHMLSVGNLRSGGEIVVTETWTAFLSFVAGSPALRILTTVGEIYGRSPLAPSDDLVTGDRATTASIAVACENGTASLLRGPTLRDGRTVVALDAPIDIVVAGWTPKKLDGAAADGRAVILEIEPAAQATGALELDVLVDHSGSMDELAQADTDVIRSKFQVVELALATIARSRLRLWEFNSDVRFVGEARGAHAQALVKQLAPPSGGTEIGRALEAVIASKKASDTLIVTDGKSWALDVQAIARSGLRVFAVLIGEDALEADIAHLAVVTGGQVFVAAGLDAEVALATAFAAARSLHKAPQTINGKPRRIEALRRGSRVVATWGAKKKGEVLPAARQVGATAAMLAIPLMPEDAAAKLAEAEGIVTHLTSLVLVDEAGERQEGIPASRKVPLPRSHIPQTGILYCIDPFISYARRDMGVPDFSITSERRQGLALTGPDEEPDNPFDLTGIADRIDWDADPEALRRGDLSGLAADVLLMIRLAASQPDIIALADKLGVSAAVVIIALLARKASGENRSAARLARAILGRTRADALTAVMKHMGL